MLIRDIIDLVDTRETPIHFYNIDNAKDQIFYSYVFTSDERSIVLKEKGIPDKPGNVTEDDLGVHFPDGDIDQISTLLRQQQPAESDWICNLLATAFEVCPENMNVSLILFVVLHEIGHWQHFVNSEMSRVEYARKFYVPQAALYCERYVAIHWCKYQKKEAENLDNIFRMRYRKLDIEREADQYAMLEFPLYSYDCIEKYREK